MSGLDTLKAIEEKYYIHSKDIFYKKPTAYIDIYASYFEPIRHMPLNVLELGVRDGESLLMWRDYFPNARIVGLDIRPPPASLSAHQADGTIACIQGDQSNISTLQQCLDQTETGEFDIIIDDASHLGILSKASFDFLFTHGLKNRGLYFLEDFGVSYTPMISDGAIFEKTIAKPGDKIFPSHSHGMVGWLKQLIDEVTLRAYQDPDKIMRPLASCHVWPNIALIEKI